MSRRYLDGNNVAGELGREREFARGANGAILSHEYRSAAADLRVRGHLNGAAHPGKLAGFGDDGFVRLESELEHRHGGAGDAALHGEPRWKYTVTQNMELRAHSPARFWP